MAELCEFFNQPAPGVQGWLQKYSTVVFFPLLWCCKATEVASMAQPVRNALERGEVQHTRTTQGGLKEWVCSLKQLVSMQEVRRVCFSVSWWSNEGPGAVTMALLKFISCLHTPPPSFPPPPAIQNYTELCSKWGGKGLKRVPGETSVFFWRKWWLSLLVKLDLLTHFNACFSSASFDPGGAFHSVRCCAVGRELFAKILSQWCSAVQQSEEHADKHSLVQRWCLPP